MIESGETYFSVGVHKYLNSVNINTCEIKKNNHCENDVMKELCEKLKEVEKFKEFHFNNYVGVEVSWRVTKKEK